MGFLQLEVEAAWGGRRRCVSTGLISSQGSSGYVCVTFCELFNLSERQSLHL